MQLFVQFVPVSSDWAQARTTPELPVDLQKALSISSEIRQVVGFELPVNHLLQP